ncbi:hypothetical protein QJ043_04350 [Olsenella sp. YH-ols2217]|uniref:Uncharacterized protein n=1 Tax=Kribbibacterium absianum TaxID=3044210 RepID=A0ABT6ZJT6_9ACTN|nr:MULTISPECIES: hypothetical protein [unclassified Olsenella]MDJ1122436.1 hypothetical protein [Olsenella sp. YH-ols2216]MDJ1129310.1 hypothetical protein [Olsenella sp. YH-ols2217]
MSGRQPAPGTLKTRRAEAREAAAIERQRAATREAQIHARAVDAATRWLGETDYDIPRFGFMSAAVIVFAFVVALFAVPSLVQAVTPAWKPGAAVVGSALVAFTFAFMQWFWERKEGATKGFWLCLVGLTAALLPVFFIVYYAAM